MTTAVESKSAPKSAYSDFDWVDYAPYFFILPAVIVMAAGLIYPVISAFYLSFYDWKIGTDMGDAPYVGLAHFKRMIFDPAVHESIWVTVRFGFWTITIEMFLGISLALLLEKPIRGASVFRTIFILPLMVSPVVVGLIWRYLFDARIGWINYYLGYIGIEPQVWLGDADLAFFAQRLRISDVGHSERDKRENGCNGSQCLDERKHEWHNTEVCWITGGIGRGRSS